MSRLAVSLEISANLLDDTDDETLAKMLGAVALEGLRHQATNRGEGDNDHDDR
jgi:hypothetical protein